VFVINTGPKVMYAKLIDSINRIEPGKWNTLVGQDYPFLRHEFLSALEQSGSVSAETGWIPQHLVIEDNDRRLIAAMPLYLKLHSRGEYVFDYQWANAYYQAGLDYYPKWLTTIPFTPCYGPRIAHTQINDPLPIFNRVLELIEEISESRNLSSWHCLFPDIGQLEHLKRLGLSIREDIQYHWFNKGYRDFADFLDEFTASKRKMVHRERRKIFEQGIELIQVLGSTAKDEEWRVFFHFYRLTYLKKGSQAYLSLSFFKTCAATLGKQMLLVFAVKDHQYLGAALSFMGTDTLYGRYWGCQDEFNFLHFETCYYQGIEYCINNGLARFDSGAQGEHKISRGFRPVSTYSAHWIKNPAFARAIQDFVTRERQQIAQYKKGAADLLPFKKTLPPFGNT